MFNLFGSKSKKEKLEAKYLKLTEKAFQLEETDTNAAADVRRKAQEIMHQIVIMERGGSSEQVS